MQNSGSHGGMCHLGRLAGHAQYHSFGRECLEEAYLNSITPQEGEYAIPYHEDLPKILDRVYPCSDIVKIDYYIPGCPPAAEHIWKVVKNLLWGESYSVLYSEFKYD